MCIVGNILILDYIYVCTMSKSWIDSYLLIPNNLSIKTFEELDIKKKVDELMKKNRTYKIKIRHIIRDEIKYGMKYSLEIQYCHLILLIIARSGYVFLEKIIPGRFISVSKRYNKLMVHASWTLIKNCYRTKSLNLCQTQRNISLFLFDLNLRWYYLLFFSCFEIN